MCKSDPRCFVDSDFVPTPCKQHQKPCPEHLPKPLEPPAPAPVTQAPVAPEPAWSPQEQAAYDALCAEVDRQQEENNALVAQQILGGT